MVFCSTSCSIYAEKLRYPRDRDKTSQEGVACAKRQMLYTQSEPVAERLDEQFRWSTEQLDQARQMLADAPHRRSCSIASVWAEEPKCTCWKAGL